MGENKVYCKGISDYGRFERDRVNDVEVIKELSAALLKADAHVTWYGTYFDIPYLNSRRIKHGLPPLPQIPHIDGWYIAKKKLKLHSNRLASVSAFLGLENKTPILQAHWLRAAAGYSASIKYVKDHNKQDVVVLEQAYEKLRALTTNHPNTSLLGRPGCPICGSNSLLLRGFNVARTTVKQRYQCRDCGGWSSGPPKSIRGVTAR